jgi:hypothetical protein
MQRRAANVRSEQGRAAVACPSRQTLGAACKSSRRAVRCAVLVSAANASGASGNAPLHAKQVLRSLRVPVARHVCFGARLFCRHVHALAWAARPASWRAASLRTMRARNPRQSPACSWSTCSGTLRHMSRGQQPSSGSRARGTGQSQAIQTPAPNPSIERTVNSQLRCLSPAAHVKR